MGKKCGVESSDPNRHSQPRLPGSVVGEASMGQAREPRKITKVSVPKERMLLPQLTEQERLRFQARSKELLSRSCSHFAVTSECVIACTDNAMRFCTPTLRINFATCAFTVRSSIPS